MLKNLTLKFRLISLIGFLALLLVGIGEYGLHGMTASNEGLRTVYEDRTVPVGQLSSIDMMMVENVGYISHVISTSTTVTGEKNVISHKLDSGIAAKSAETIEKNLDEQSKLWTAYLATYLTPEEKKLADAFAPKQAKLHDEAIVPAVAALKAGNYEEVRRLYLEKVLPLQEDANSSIEALTDLQFGVAKSEYEKAKGNYETTSLISKSTIVIGILLAAFFGWLTIRAIIVPLTRLLGYFDNISKGNFDNEIAIEQQDEIGKVLHELKTVQARLAQARAEAADYQGQIEAIGKSTGVIEFNLDGTVITANPIFLNILGYSLEEAKGKHHSTFVDPAYAASADYRAFWEKLNRGEFVAGEFHRVGKGGKEIWLQASYNPIRDANGKIYKVVKFASDTTAQKRYQLMVEKVLAETKAVMQALAQGDLTNRMNGEYDGEFAVLSDAVNQSIANLREIVEQITQAVDLIGTASKEIAAGNTDLSQRTEEQASSLEETASSMEELASTVKQNAENARQANQMAAAASTVAIKGGSVVNEVVTTMSAINDSSRKIVDIISVIDGIAFQTNILALNAAVEAARAGEQGRGFAVVAGEVRNLAQRSAAAAKEIKQLISDSVEKVEGGTRQVEEAGHTMEEIVTSVKRVTDIMAEIAAASIEQSTGIDQVNQAVTQMDEVTQQNAALVEEAAAAAESLEEQANELANAVSAFKLDGSSSESTLRRPSIAVTKATKPTPALPSAPAKKRVAKPPKVQASDEWEEF